MPVKKKAQVTIHREKHDADERVGEGEHQREREKSFNVCQLNLHELALVTPIETTLQQGRRGSIMTQNACRPMT